MKKQRQNRPARVVPERPKDVPGDQEMEGAPPIRPGRLTTDRQGRETPPPAPEDNGGASE